MNFDNQRTIESFTFLNELIEGGSSCAEYLQSCDLEPCCCRLR